MGEEGGTGGRRRVLNASHSSSLQKARVTEYSGRAVEKKNKKILDLVQMGVYCNTVRVIYSGTSKGNHCIMMLLENKIHFCCL